MTAITLKLTPETWEETEPHLRALVGKPVLMIDEKGKAAPFLLVGMLPEDYLVRCWDPESAGAFGPHLRVSYDSIATISSLTTKQLETP